MRAVGQFLEQVQEELAQAKDSDLTPYRYQPVVGERGQTDAHYANRLRLALALQFGENRDEALVRTLLEEEILAREGEAFQGIGAALEILTGLLLTYGRQADEALYLRAKNANFDCFCGFTPGEPVYPRSVEAQDRDFWIELCGTLGEKALLNELVESYLAEQTQWRWDNVQIWRRYEELRDNDQGELLALVKMHELARQQGPWDDCAAAQKLAAKLIDRAQYRQAWQVLEQAVPSLEKARTDWYSLGLGRFWLESCMDILLGTADEAQRRAAWQWSAPYLKCTLDNMHGNLYEKAARAAELMQDASLAKELRQRLAEKRRALEAW